MTALEKLNAFGRNRRPCLFLFDYTMDRPIVMALDQIEAQQILYDFRGNTNAGDLTIPLTLGDTAPGLFAREAPTYQSYREAFAVARQAFLSGHSYLLNLCAASKVQFRGSLDTLFAAVRAPYRLRVKLSDSPGDSFLVFSPEPFVRIADNRISAFPMKGSLKCRYDQVDGYRTRLLADAKELAEHITIVDLIRNDLGKVASNVVVDRFRYVEEISLPESVLLQTSSEISGQLSPDWPDSLGDIMRGLLPAGSITGAPKSSTTRIIAQAEAGLGGRRGFYTGVCGIFDGAGLESAVMIRFLEDHGTIISAETPARELHAGVFRSGGGLTVYSRPQAEYRELVAKIALPIPPPLLETIRIENDQAQNLAAHRQRMAGSLKACYGVAEIKDLPWSLDLVLAEAVQAVRLREGVGRWRCRIIYSDLRAEWTVEPYVLRRPKTLYLVEAGDLEYSHKYANRQALDSLRQQVAAQITDPGGDWDILLTHQGLLLETSYSAIVVETDQGLLTPATTLLPSTRIVELLQPATTSNGPEIRRADIKVADIGAVRRIFLVNAMIGLDDAVAVTDIHILESARFHGG